MPYDIVSGEALFQWPLSYLLWTKRLGKTSIYELKRVVPMVLNIFSNAEHIRRCPVPCFYPIVCRPQLRRRIRAAKYFDPDLTRRRVVKVWTWGVCWANGTSLRFAKFLQVVIGPKTAREAAVTFSRRTPVTSKQAVLELTLFVEFLYVPSPPGNWFLVTWWCRERAELWQKLSKISHWHFLLIWWNLSKSSGERRSMGCKMPYYSRTDSTKSLLNVNIWSSLNRRFVWGFHWGRTKVLHKACTY